MMAPITTTPAILSTAEPMWAGRSGRIDFAPDDMAAPRHGFHQVQARTCSSAGWPSRQ
jgi:hypothetical protein